MIETKSRFHDSLVGSLAVSSIHHEAAQLRDIMAAYHILTPGLSRETAGISIRLMS